MITVYSGSFPTTRKKPLPIWRTTAQDVFGKNLLKDSVVKENGLYDKVIMDCSFKETLGKSMDLTGGCKYFKETLTGSDVYREFIDYRFSIKLK